MSESKKAIVSVADCCDKFCQEQNENGIEWHFETDYEDSCVSKNGTVVKMSGLFYRVSPSEEYWYYRVLGLNVTENSVVLEDNSWEHWGEMQWELLGCLALSWMIICLFLSKGIQSYGKVVYFTTLFPYVVLTILLGYTATLEGFVDGLEFYFVPRWYFYNFISQHRQGG